MVCARGRMATWSGCLCPRISAYLELVGPKNEKILELIEILEACRSGGAVKVEGILVGIFQTIII